jgi:catechol 2,3-dioxygenase-like lactoylglutathione lyase family enzyme
MLTNPDHVVLGTTDLAATAAFLEAFGFEPAAEAGTLATDQAGALYGLDRETEQVLLGVPGVRAGRLRLVATPHADATHDPYALGGHALDIYTSDLEASLAVAEAAGALSTSPVARIELGPLVMRQAMVRGPDGLPLVLVEANRRRPTVLDADPDRLHSEAHSIVWAVADVDAAARPLEQAGLPRALDVPITDPEVAKVLGVPPERAHIRMALLGDPDGPAPRMELLAFADPPTGPAGSGSPPGAREPLRARLHAPVFVVPPDVDIEQAQWSWVGQRAEMSLPGIGPATARKVCSAGGVILELWQPAGRVYNGHG